MKGLELTFKNKTISAAIPKGSLHIIVGQKIEENGESNFILNFTALDTRKNEFVDWCKTGLEIGDKLEIEVKEITEISTPISTSDASCDILQSKLHSYNKLKEELEKEGFI